jgi:hypothetical protein
MILKDAAEVLRRRCREVGDPPASSRSDYFFARRYGCPLREVHEVAQSFTPERSQVGLYRDVEADIITYFYVARLSANIEQELRRRYGSPISPKA